VNEGRAPLSQCWVAVSVPAGTKRCGAGNDGYLEPVKNKARHQSVLPSFDDPSILLPRLISRVRFI
jgi:hypothetical protein